jgi:hypothetical protein
MGAEVGEHPCTVGHPVSRAKTGIQFWCLHGTPGLSKALWVPAFAGTTEMRNSLSRLWGEG